MKALLLFAALCVACYAGPTQDIPGDKQPAADTILTLSKEPATSGKIIILPNSTGDWIPVTLQEALDVVKAMEIMKRIAGLIQYSGSNSTITLDVVGHLSPWQETPEELRARANQIEAEQKAVEQNRKDVLWAESILELWRKKVEAIK